MNKEYCMKNRCNGCKNYAICFNYKPKRRMKNENNDKSTYEREVKRTNKRRKS